MLAHAAARGIEVVEGVAEHLPFADHSFDHALLVTTLCFLDAPDQALREARRVLTPDGRLVIGFVDRNSALGQLYAQRREQSLFYREATFRSAEEVEQLLLGSGFAIEAWGQTLAQAPDEMCEIDPLRPGHGQCPFVVVAASPACAPSEVSLAGWVRAPEERPGPGAGLARRADRFTGPG
jgi:SAM-dependent methyltransferase